MSVETPAPPCVPTQEKRRAAAWACAGSGDIGSGGVTGPRSQISGPCRMPVCMPLSSLVRPVIMPVTTTLPGPTALGTSL
ncbi:hypothetical protein GCM10017668_41770 [Streptomyces tuirus]|uniref:Uncharacterized protein n=1 Tax=Streptomyces tuirus TaxID=68278 RepID=A0A7G1NKV5_9ACTN|nr:hypothetical protein GCM10017668_41770 [Streptomyces tuirus]